MKSAEHEQTEATRDDNNDEGSVKGLGLSVGQAKAMVGPEDAVGSDGLTILHWEGGDFGLGPVGGRAQFSQQQISTWVSFVLPEPSCVGRQ